MEHKIAYNNKNFNIVSHDAFMDECLIKGSFYEITMLNYIYNLLLSGVYIDIGAFIGNHSIFFSELCNSTQVISYEPLDINFDILQLNTKKYSKIILKQMALGEKEGNCTIKPFNGNLGMSKISDSIDGKTLMTTIDKDLKNITEKICLIKIDVEGFEYRVLSGSLNIINKHRPHLFIETTNNHGKIGSLLKQFNYELIDVFNNTPTYYFKPI